MMVFGLAMPLSSFSFRDTTSKATPYPSLEYALTWRPGYGTSGTPVTPWANYAEIVHLQTLRSTVITFPSTRALLEKY
jgi:hypothetical protein